MDDGRERLLVLLEEQYQRSGWRFERGEHHTVRASGPGGVTWIGLAVVEDDLESDRLEPVLEELGGQRMPTGGELCPLDLLPEPECEARLRAVLERLGLTDRPHVSVYSFAT